MPFPTQTPQPFTTTAVRGLWPGHFGCYGLFNRFGWIYIGKGAIRDRLSNHLRGDNPVISRYRPTHFVVTYALDYDNLEKRLIAEYRPPANQRIG